MLTDLPAFMEMLAAGNILEVSNEANTQCVASTSGVHTETSNEQEVYAEMVKPQLLDERITITDEEYQEAYRSKLRHDRMKRRYGKTAVKEPPKDVSEMADQDLEAYTVKKEMEKKRQAVNKSTPTRHTIDDFPPFVAERLVDDALCEVSLANDDADERCRQLALLLHQFCVWHEFMDGTITVSQSQTYERQAYYLSKVLAVSDCTTRALRTFRQLDDDAPLALKADVMVHHICTVYGRQHLLDILPQLPLFEPDHLDTQLRKGFVAATAKFEKYLLTSMHEIRPSLIFAKHNIASKKEKEKLSKALAARRRPDIPSDWIVDWELAKQHLTTIMTQVLDWIQVQTTCLGKRAVA